MSIKQFISSVRDAFNGFSIIFRSEQNFRVQTAVSLVVLVAAVYFPLRVWEVILIILLIVMVLTMEMLNTAFEYIADLLKPRLHHYVRSIKDIMAAAVFLTALGAGVIGFIIFLPHFLILWK